MCSLYVDRSYQHPIPTITAQQLKECPAEVLSQVQYGKQRIAATRYRRQVVALVSIQDVILLEKLEGVVDAPDAQRAVETARQEGLHALAELLEELKLTRPCRRSE